MQQNTDSEFYLVSIKCNDTETSYASSTVELNIVKSKEDAIKYTIKYLMDLDYDGVLEHILDINYNHDLEHILDNLYDIEDKLAKLSNTIELRGNKYEIEIKKIIINNNTGCYLGNFGHS
uniref:Uncharacterized protein n=1 Tax=viral metagenome TaxID=1070528 RepID=A0A6C0J574_9ZZZZ